MKNNIIFIFPFIIFLFFFDNSFADQNYEKYYHQAMKLSKSGRAAEGERLLSSIIHKNKRVGELYIWRGRYRNGMANYISAIKDFNIAEKLSVTPWVEIPWFRGRSYYHLQMYNQAIMDYTKAIRMQPKRKKMYIYRAKAYAKIGRIGQAKNDLNTLVKYGGSKYKKIAEDLYMKMLKGKDNY